jgi:hypothetical protein
LSGKLTLGGNVTATLVKASEHNPMMVKCSLEDHFVSRTPVPVVFFYRKKIPSELFINSLRYVLKDFPIFAGILIQQKDGQLYIDCNNQGVEVSIFQSPLSLFDQLKNFSKLARTTFVNLIEPKEILKYRKPVLSIKLSYYSDGMAIGYYFHHSIGDFSTLMEFLRALSAHAKGEVYSLPSIAEDRVRYMLDWLKKEGYKQDKGKPCRLKSITLFDAFQFIKLLFSPKQGGYLYFTHDEIETLRSTLMEKSGCKLSQNDVLCAHLLETISRCRSDKADTYYASLFVNYRKLINLPANLLGNFIDMIPVRYTKPVSADTLAGTINHSVRNYLQTHFDPYGAAEFLKQKGEGVKFESVIPEVLLPKYKNLIISNWSNSGVYSIDFGIIAPYLFMPVGKKARFPWLSSIVEGFHNRGLLVSIVLPKKIGRRLFSSEMLQAMHRYRGDITPEDKAVLDANPWCH